jgi:LAS superfamily LD-carboxypeptidase LdcB
MVGIEDKWFELLPTVRRTVFISGVPATARLVEIQPAGVIAELGRHHPAQYLESVAGRVWVLMRRAAELDGINLIAYSAFRRHSHQQRLWDEWQAGKRRLRPSRPGWSLHESARAVDVLRSHDDPDAGGPLVGTTDEWLAEHAHEFGFFRTVPQELWHYEHKGLNG